VFAYYANDYNKEFVKTWFLYQKQNVGTLLRDLGEEGFFTKWSIEPVVYIPRHLFLPIYKDMNHVLEKYSQIKVSSISIERKNLGITRPFIIKYKKTFYALSPTKCMSLSVLTHPLELKIQERYFYNAFKWFFKYMEKVLKTTSEDVKDLATVFYVNPNI